MKNKQAKQMIESVLDDMLNKHLNDDRLYRLYFNRAVGFFRPDFGNLCGVVSIPADKMKSR